MSQGFDIKSAARKKGSLSQAKLKASAEIAAIQQSLVEHFGDIKDGASQKSDQ